MKVSEAIEKRWSPRAFSQEKIDENVLQNLFKAAGSAPSAFNEQPWRYIIGRNGDETFNLILDCLVPFNQDWAKTAAVLALGICSTKYKKNAKDNAYALHDLGAASSYLTIKAMEEDIFVHQMAGFDKEKAENVFHLPEGYKATTVLAIGKMGNPEVLPKELQAKENQNSDRMPVNSYVFTGDFGNPGF